MVDNSRKAGGEASKVRGDAKKSLDMSKDSKESSIGTLELQKGTIEPKKGTVESPKGTDALKKGSVESLSKSKLPSKEGTKAGGYEIYYTIDGKTPSPKTGILYTEPITVDKDMTVKAVAVDGKGRMSQVVEAQYVRYVRDKDITYVTKPDNQYYAGGNEGLIDNARGKVNYRIGGWQGFTTDCELIIDLREMKKITTVGAGCLEEQRSWIFYPKGMEVFVSEDGNNYKPFNNVTITSARTEGAHIQDLEVKGDANARYVKIVIKNYGKLPEWHLSAGEQAWLFVDEVWVK